MYRVLLIVILVIVYGSLYPWDFHSTQLAASPLWVLVHSWPTSVDRFLFRDIAVNVLLYMPVGVFGFLALRQNVRTAFAATATVLIALALSSSIEMIQLFDDARVCSASDVVCNVSGTVLGVALGSLYQQWLKAFLGPRRNSSVSASVRSSAALLYLACLSGISSIPGAESDAASREIPYPLRRCIDFSTRDLHVFCRVVDRCTAARKCAGRGADPPMVSATAARPAGQTIYRG